MIALEQVSKIYKKKGEQNSVVALDNISIKIDDDSFVSVSGRSGSGKSTLLHLIGGVDRPTTGKVIINGIDINTMTDNELADFRNNTIGFVFQSFLLEPSLTALENVELPLLLRSIGKIQRMKLAIEMLEKVGLEHRFQHKPYELSGGEKQRVSIARALVTSPKYLLADEPTGNLDETTGRNTIQLMRSLTENCTFILVTHDLEEAKNAPIRIVMNDGKVVSHKHIRED